MPTELDPAWEYYVPDPEIAELMAGARVVFDVFVGRGEKERALGFAQVSRSDGYRSTWPLVALPYDRLKFALKECAGCGYYFRPDRETQRYCNRTCRPPADPDRARLRRRLRGVTHECPTCHVSYAPWVKRQVYCSVGCIPRRGVNRPQGSLICRWCLNPFPRPRYAHGNRKKFCGRGCLAAAYADRRTTKGCERCGVRFYAYRASLRFCSRKCRGRLGGLPLCTQTKKCEWCNEDFKLAYKDQPARYCCKSHARKAYHAGKRV